MDTYDDDKETGSSPSSNLRRRGRFQLQVPHNPSSFAPSSSWSNQSLDPVKPSERVWSTLDYTVYWWSDALAIATWQLGSSMVSGGLDWKLAIVAIACGQLIVSQAIIFNGTIGSRLHIPFPIIVRASFGFYWAYFAIVSRLVVGVFWLGITAVSGGQCVEVLLNAIWPSFRNIPNQIPEKMGVTTAGMIAYFLYFLIQFPLLLMPWTKIKHVFAFKSVVGLVVFLAIFGNTVSRAGGVATATLVGSTPQATGSAKVWLFFGSMNSVLGGYATFSVSVADFSRYSRTRNTQWIQGLVSPLSMTFIASLGVMTAASTTAVYGEVLWNPTTIIDMWTSRSGRAAAAFCAMGLVFVQVGINVAANSIAAGNDFVALCPKYVNLARGQVLAAIAGCWILCPWIVIAQASSFLTFIGQYTIVLGPIASVVLFDYWVVKGQKLNVPQLYQPHGIYAYNKYGTNWRAVVAVLVGSGPGWPGFVNAIQPNIYVTVGAQHIIQLGFLYSFALSAALYVGLSYFFPDPNVLLSEEVTGEDTVVLFDDQGSA